VIAAALSPAGPLYKYVDIAGLKRILAGSIRFTQPSAFNDPFELLPEVVVPNDATERQLNFPFDVRAQRRHPPPGALDAVPDGCQASDAMSRDIVQQFNGPQCGENWRSPSLQRYRDAHAARLQSPRRGIDICDTVRLAGC
jgi:hypothetical protein